MVYWWAKKGKLIFVKKRATPEFWDNHWEESISEERVKQARRNRFWRKMLDKYVPEKGARILEGGCGKGQLVDAMCSWGYKGIGVDFAKETIKRVKKIAPELDVRYGDVRHLEFGDDFFDGYCSLGVIEHVWEGYEEVVAEMYRVLKQGGYAFLTFPCISPFDRLKILLGGYKKFQQDQMPEGFYQFALDMNEVVKDLNQLGFDFVSCRGRGGLLGLERLLPVFKSINIVLRSLSKKSRVVKLLVMAVSSTLAPLCGHSVILVMKKL